MKILTHNGTFHCDDVMGYVILTEAIAQPLQLIRTRNTDLIQSASIVWDVGDVFDPNTQRFDHHMREKPIRENGIPYSAAGLLWQHYGHACVANMLRDPSPNTIENVWKEIDQSLILDIDRDDNGVGKGSNPLGTIVNDFRLQWNEPHNADTETKRFQEAADVLRGILYRRIIKTRATLEAQAIVLQAAKGPDPRVLDLPAAIPWERIVREMKLDRILYVVYPSQDSWRIQTVPTEEGPFTKRKPLPEKWAGLQNEALSNIIGIPDAVFAHTGRFLAGAKSRESILKMLKIALDHKE